MSNQPSIQEPAHDEAARPSWARGWMGDSSQLLASQILTVIATSVAAIMIARTLDPDDWAIFSAFLGLGFALTIVADLGISGWLLRELSALADARRTSPRIAQIVSHGIVLNGLVALPLLVAASTWTIVARPGAATSVALLALLTYGALSTVANALEAHLRARREVRLVLLTSVLEKFILVILVVASALAEAGIVAIGLAYVAASVSRVAFDGYIVYARQGLDFVRPHLVGLLDVARASYPFALNGAALNLAPRLDTFLLLALSATSAAWFAIGDRVLGPALLVPSTLASALYPFMAAHTAKSTSPWKLAGVMGVVGAAIACVGIVLAPLVVPLVFGETYADAVPVVQVMLVSLPLVYATSPLLVIAYSHGQEYSLLLPTLLTSLAGTIAIVIGQMLGGPVAAGAGFAARFGLFLIVVGTVAHVAWRRHTATSLRRGATPVPAKNP